MPRKAKTAIPVRVKHIQRMLENIFRESKDQGSSDYYRFLRAASELLICAERAAKSANYSQQAPTSRMVTNITALEDDPVFKSWRFEIESHNLSKRFKVKKS